MVICFLLFRRAFRRARSIPGDHGRLYEGKGEGLVPQEGQRPGGFVPVEFCGGFFFILIRRRMQASSRTRTYVRTRASFKRFELV